MHRNRLCPRNVQHDDFRFDTPLYTTAEAADIANIPSSTLRGWAKPRTTGRPMVTSLPAGLRREPTIPFVGAVEALVLAAFHSTGKPLHRIRPALEEQKPEQGSAIYLPPTCCSPTVPIRCSTTPDTVATVRLQAAPSENW